MLNTSVNREHTLNIETTQQVTNINPQKVTTEPKPQWNKTSFRFHWLNSQQRSVHCCIAPDPRYVLSKGHECRAKFPYSASRYPVLTELFSIHPLLWPCSGNVDDDRAGKFQCLPKGRAASFKWGWGRKLHKAHR